jgi:glycosyltransferase involved in cell wall biosynthesis
VFHGQVERDAFIKQINNFRFFVHPSLSESFSPIRIEMMAAGRPGVYTKIAGSDEMIENERNGYLVPTRDSDSLAEKIMELLEDYDLTSRMGRKARETAEKKYDIDKIARRYLNLYERGAR